MMVQSMILGADPCPKYIPPPPSVAVLPAIVQLRKVGDAPSKRAPPPNLSAEFPAILQLSISGAWPGPIQIPLAVPPVTVSRESLAPVRRPSTVPSTTVS